MTCEDCRRDYALRCPVCNEVLMRTWDGTACPECGYYSRYERVRDMTECRKLGEE
jgi:uncharacterized Zn finger protein (UPF0148 family)